jgi:hypothetical protein
MTGNSGPLRPAPHRKVKAAWAAYQQAQFTAGAAAANSADTDTGKNAEPRANLTDPDSGC